MVTCMTYHDVTGIVAVGGKLTETDSSVSLWKLTSKPPYYQLLHSTQSVSNSSFLSSFNLKFSPDNNKNLIHKVIILFKCLILILIIPVNIFAGWKYDSWIRFSR